jgi:phage-related tail protein
VWFRIRQTIPYYAINSKIINRVCDSEEQAKIQKEQAKITKDTTVIYTLGYEGISLLLDSMPSCGIWI